MNITLNDRQNSSSIPLFSILASRLPYAYQIVDIIARSNPKFEVFRKQASQKENLIASESIFAQHSQLNDQKQGFLGNISIHKDYQAFVYADVDRDKTKRLLDYRKMATYAELADCLDEICDECLVVDEHGNYLKFDLKGNYGQLVKEDVKAEFQRFIEIFDLQSKGWERFRKLLIDGELFFENVIKEDSPQLGILGIVEIPPEIIDPVYDNVQNDIIKGFVVRKPAQGYVASLNKEDSEQLIFLQKKQVTYIHSGIWNEAKTIRLPFIENSKRAYRLLSLIEDSIVIYRLVRAPERLVFKVYTGTMPPPKAEAYVKRMMQRLWTSRTNTSLDGKVTNIYDPQSMLDAFWFTKDAQGNGTDVSTLPGGQSLGQLDDLNYFLTKLYKSLKVPISRFLTAGDPFRDGAEITRDELRFARLIMRLQNQFAVGIKEAFITHLKLKGKWKEYKLKEIDIKLKFNEPTTFMAMRNQQLLNMKFESYNQAIQSEAISKSFAQVEYLGWNVQQMKENREWLRNDAALKWELSQIENNGPNFREILQQQSEPGESEDSSFEKSFSDDSSSPPLPDLPPPPSFGSADDISDNSPEANLPNDDLTQTEPQDDTLQVANDSSAS